MSWRPLSVLETARFLHVDMASTWEWLLLPSRPVRGLLPHLLKGSPGTIRPTQGNLPFYDIKVNLLGTLVIPGIIFMGPVHIQGEKIIKGMHAQGQKSPQSAHSRVCSSVITGFSAQLEGAPQQGTVSVLERVKSHVSL